MSTPTRRARVLFLCTGNSCRSQMAEGFARALRADVLDPCSAGIHPKALDPLAVAAMAEVGVDISGHRPKPVAELGGAFDLVVTVCDAAREACPALAGARAVHAGFPDPPQLAAGARSTEEALAHYRRVRDQIRCYIETMPVGLLGENCHV